MSPVDYKIVKLGRNEARKRIAEIANKWPQNVKLSRHAEEELLKDGLMTSDALNVLRSSNSKILDEGELKNGSWRYRLQTTNLMMVIAFWPNGEGLTVVTGWDRRKGGSK